MTTQDVRSDLKLPKKLTLAKEDYKKNVCMAATDEPACFRVEK